MKRHAAIPFLISCVAQNAAPIDDSWSEESKADEPSAGGVTITHAADARLLDGFHKLLDARTARCVEAVDDGVAFTVGAIEKPFDLFFVANKEDLAKTLGIDVGLKIKYAGAAVGPSVAFLDSFRQTRSSIHLLVAAKASYRVTNTRQVELTTTASEWLANDARTFLHRCGNFFVNGIEHEAQLFVMIRIDALSEDATRAINADLGIGTATAAIGIDADVKVKIERIAKRNDVAIETHVLDRGFLVDGGTGPLVAQLLTDGVSRATFDKIDAIREAMLDSIAKDLERDQKYETNAVRHALPVKVDLRPYSRALNAPLGGPGSPYEAMRQTVDRASAYLRGLGRVALRIDRARGEAMAFLGASSARRTFYGVAPPAAPVFKPDALVAIAVKQRDALDVTMTGVATAIANCWGAATEGAPEVCSGDTAALPDVMAANAALAHYASARIVPVRFAAKGVLGYAGGNDACAKSAMRLPTYVEAQRLAMAVGYGAFPRTTEERLRYAVWHANTSMCTGGDLSAFANVPNGAAQNVCTAEGWLTPHPTLTLCVPPAGPFDDLSAL